MLREPAQKQACRVLLAGFAPCLSLQGLAGKIINEKRRKGCVCVSVAKAKTQTRICACASVRVTL